MNWINKLRPIAGLSRNASRVRVKSVASLDEALASRELGHQTDIEDLEDRRTQRKILHRPNSG